MGAFDHLDNIFDRDKDKLISNGKREIENETERNHSTNLIADLGVFYDGGEFHAKPLLLNLDKDKIKTKLNTEPKKAASREQENEDTNQSTSGVTFNHRHAFNAGVWESVAGYYDSTEDKDKKKAAFKEKGINSGLFNLDKTTIEVENKGDQIWNYSTSVRAPFTLGLKQELKFGGAFRHRDRFRAKQAREVNNKGVSKDTTKPKDAYELAENYFAGFVQDTVWLTDRFSLLPGVRVEHVGLESESGDGAQANKSIADINPSFHALYRFRDDLSLRAAFSKSVNRPKFDELSPFEQDDGNKITIGNPDLNPARSWNFDIGGDYAAANLFLGVNLFHKEITGVIEEVDTGLVQDGKHVFQVENVGNGWTRGIELEQRLSFGFLGVRGLEGLQLWANETLLESRLQEANGNTRRFKQQPNFMANLGLDYTHSPSGATVTAALNYVAERRDYKATGDVTSIDPAVTLDISARQRIYKGVSVFGEVENVTDERRVESESLVNGTTSRKTEAYGRTFMAGLNLQF